MQQYWSLQREYCLHSSPVICLFLRQSSSVHEPCRHIIAVREHHYLKLAPLLLSIPYTASLDLWDAKEPMKSCAAQAQNPKELSHLTRLYYYYFDCYFFATRLLSFLSIMGRVWVQLTNAVPSSSTICWSVIHQTILTLCLDYNRAYLSLWS